MSPTQQETHAAELAEVETLAVEGGELLDRIGKALETTAGEDLVRYLALRRRLNEFMTVNGFPLPPANQMARKVRADLDRKLALTLEPIRKMLR